MLPRNIKCKKCSTDMVPSQYIENTYTSGMPDFHGDCPPPGRLQRGQTMYIAGPGNLKPCLKCPECGWSMTAPDVQPYHPERTKDEG